MIRYEISVAELKEKIREEDADWFDKAEGRTELLRGLGKYKESSTIWRRVVRVYMRVQHNKCAFCERKFEGSETGGTREFDIEHFRPKSSVKAWPTARLISEEGLEPDFPSSEGSQNGYFLLPYHMLNYTVACKPCNSSFKSNFFPIEGTRDIGNDDPSKMKGEEAYLVYPIGTLDEDPERVLRYDGVMAVPVNKSGKRHQRARVTIVFFQLNSREEHFFERSEKLSHLFLALEEIHQPKSRLHKRLATAAVKRLTSEKNSHTNCSRSFKKLYETDRPHALKIIDGITKLLESSS